MNAIDIAGSSLVIPARDFQVGRHGTRITPAMDKTWDPPWVPDSSEWYWFAREYSRCYRYHFDCANYRITSMHQRYLSLANEIAQQIAALDTPYLSLSNPSVRITYWEFDAFLGAVNSALDILARLVGFAYRDQMPPSFNRLCGRNLSGLAELLSRAQILWVRRMKDYRDCFVHYTPVDTLLTVSAYMTSNGRRLHMRLPTNPNVRDIQEFRFNHRTELMTYAAATYRHFVALDKATAAEIRRLYRKGEYPKRTTHLSGVGARRRRPTAE